MPSPETWALIISGISLGSGTVVAPVVTHIFTRRRMRQELKQGKELAAHEARVQYELDAQRRLAETIGASKSQILDAAYDLHRRLENLAEQIQNKWGGEASWLASPPKGNYGYYFISSIHRVLRLAAWIEILNRSLTYVDQSIPGSVEERAFLNHLRFVQNTVSETRLFRGLAYQVSFESAHIFADNLVAMAEHLIQPKGETQRETVMRIMDFRREFERGEEFRNKFGSLISLLEDFDLPEKQPFKWARLVAIHYAVAKLLSRFGYDFHRVANPTAVLDRLHLADGDERYSADKVKINLLSLAEECSLPLPERTTGGDRQS